MADLVCTAGSVSPAFHDARVRSVVLGASLLGGVPIYIDSNGLGQQTSSASASTAQFAGIVVPKTQLGYAAGAGQAADVITEGEVEGYNLSAAPFWAPVYLTDDGGIGLTAGTHTCQIGVVVPTTDRDGNGVLRKLIRIRVPVNTVVS